MRHLKKLLNYRLFVATVSNIALALYILNKIKEKDMESIQKLAVLAGNVLIQMGIMSTEVGKNETGLPKESEK